jgi:hypothetical protein
VSELLPPADPSIKATARTRRTPPPFIARRVISGDVDFLSPCKFCKTINVHMSSKIHDVITVKRFPASMATIANAAYVRIIDLERDVTISGLEASVNMTAIMTVEVP